ncbi:hypothetical protein COO60DRAFT_1509240 [Scenedesmus sp. NREL 46B-D3]|nr:hypothetical protein COO60DRAFT_1509240 [Scenedesmus sp. NREL 46B-D3]
MHRMLGLHIALVSSHLAWSGSGVVLVPGLFGVQDVARSVWCVITVLYRGWLRTRSARVSNGSSWLCGTAAGKTLPVCRHELLLQPIAIPCLVLAYCTPVDAGLYGSSSLLLECCSDKYDVVHAVAPGLPMFARQQQCCMLLGTFLAMAQYCWHHELTCIVPQGMFGVGNVLMGILFF